MSDTELSPSTHLTTPSHASLSYIASLHSTLQIHNETANIWTHLLGSLHFILTLYTFLALSPTTTRTANLAAVALFQLCVVVCFTLSTIYHIFSDHSQSMHRFGNELDHLGIVFVMWGTGISAAQFAFACPTHASLRYGYFVLLTAVGVACAVFTLRPKFRTRKYRTMRFLAYCAFGVSLFLPMAHGGVKFGLDGLSERMHLESCIGVGVINFSGAAVYAARVPERWFPGTFDLLGQSHNWMHVIVYTGALVRLSGLLVVCERWQEESIHFEFCDGAR